ncbi:TEA/ATTS domain family-domain-containing protein [Exophiala viscosa]|uniref:TEA/ATTS domain family-domain-containing protein n=1 Tax=Exophiala viscosa TaxID=2486360 RepID=UPI00219EDE22|nr:TEA/ATTS domain family-domain-containing protein [Exophiala viscosa]
MDMLHSGLSALEYSQDQAPSAMNPLSISSGNIQSSIASLGDGVENQHPLTLGDGADGVSIKAPFRLFQPPVALGSNDFSDRSVEQKQERKPSKSRYVNRALLNQDRPYLSHPKYDEYRRRPRQDIGKDGKPIWPQPIEDAFQDALVAIKPMGRKKWSEGGRLHGRNMLIARYIYEKTGVWRERKQVSSHIQVLDRFLKGIPEWDRLIKFDDEDDTKAPDGRQFYPNSTGHQMAKRHKMAGFSDRQRQHSFVKKEADASYGTDGGAAMTICLATYRVQRVHFEMWVSLPGELQHALHNYTRLEEDNQLMDIHLDEAIDNWGHAFPHLHSIRYELSTFNHCEMVLFNANFYLMNDFPPRHSKLGIGLELDFQCDEWPEMQWAKEKKSWSCITHIYQDGHLLMPPTHEECYGSQQGNVKPLFQSRWWASVLTSLTETKKLAEENKNIAAMELADLRSQNFFKGLTIMQEIFALRCRSDQRPHKNQKPRRAAILLWKFSQAALSSAAITTWRNVTLRSGSDSPGPHGQVSTATGMDLPALPMDSMADYGMHIGSFEDNSHFSSQHQGLPFDMFPTSMDEELCQDGFMALDSAQMAGLDHLQSSFHLPGTHGFNGDSTADQQDGSFARAHVDPPSSLPDAMQAANLFEFPQLLGQETSLSNMTYNKDECVDETQHEVAQDEDQPLARFNIQAHQALQERLGADEADQSATLLPSAQPKQEPDLSQSNNLSDQNWHQLNEEDLSVLRFLTEEQRRHGSIDDQPWAGEDHDDETLRAALFAASAESGEHHHQQPRPQTHDSLDRDHAYAQRPHQPLRVLPLALRPTLHSHHSFPGLRQDPPAHVFQNNDNSFESAFGNVHPIAHHGSMLQSQFNGQAVDQISASYPVDNPYAPVVVSEGSRGLPRAQSEPDPFLGGLLQVIPPLPVLESQQDEDDTTSGTQVHSQSQSTDGLALDGSFVEVSMDDIQG